MAPVPEEEALGPAQLLLQLMGPLVLLGAASAAGSHHIISSEGPHFDLCEAIELTTPCAHTH